MPDRKLITRDIACAIKDELNLVLLFHFHDLSLYGG